VIFTLLGFGDAVSAVASPLANPFSTERESALSGWAANDSLPSALSSAIGSPGPLQALDEPGTPRRGTDKLHCGAIYSRTFDNSLIVTASSEEPTGYTPTQLQDAYRIPKKGGSGQTIAIIATGHDPNAEADLEKYRFQFGLPPCKASNGCFRQVDENGTTSHFPPDSLDSAKETSLDLDMASVACQECKLLLVEGNMATAVDTAASLGATEISISQAQPDASVSLLANRHFNHPGIPITAASGDKEYRNVGQGANSPSYPASAPGVIAVGGTELTPAPGTPRGWTDNVWASTGSGCSAKMPRPTWQNFIACGTKVTNDVSIVAANVAMYDSYVLSGSAYWDTVEGTSIGAPLVAGILAHASRMVRDQPAKALYKDLEEGFGSVYDVGPSKTANNTNYAGGTCSPLYLCNAVAGKDGKSLEGYDGPTGVGVPQGVPVLPVWVEQSVNNVDIRPTVLNAPDVDCVSATMCMAVGSELSPGDPPVAAEWNGYEWSPVSVPSETKESEWLGGLTGVSCPAANFCMAVGEIPTASLSWMEAYVLQWDGYHWELDESAPRLAGDFWSAPYSVSCTSATDCVIVGGESSGSPEGSPLMSAQWKSGGWSTLEVPYPSGTAEALLEDVSCAAEEVENEEEETEEGELCLAVGWQYSITAEAFQAFVERWNGYSWSVDTNLSPPGFQSFLYDVSCPSVYSCMTVGWMSESPENEKYKDTVPMSEAWNGSEWILGKPPLPEPKINPNGTEQEVQVTEEEREEEEEGELYGVSCATPTSCITVGIDFSTGYIIGGWNGTSWSEQQKPEMPSGPYWEGEQVDCVEVSFCEVIGESAGAGVFFNGLTEDPAPYLGAGTMANPSPESSYLSGTVNPNGLATTYQFDYGTTTSYGSKSPATPKSIGSGSSMVEVSQEIEGLEPETTYHYRLVASNEKGTVEGEDKSFTTPSWKLLSTPNPSGATDTELFDVSCEPSTSACTAVGKSTVSGADRPVAQRWNGTSWSEQSAAKKSGTLPTRLFGVDCPSETRCLAAGNYQPSEGGPTLVTEVWNEGKWSVQTTPVPSGAASSELTSIGCNSTAGCRAAGSAVIGGVKTAIIEGWVSPNWTLMTVPIPEGATSSQLDGIDCIWSNVCLAVGRYTTSGGSVKKLAMLWDGTTWSLQTPAEPEGALESKLLDVSCTKSPTRCTAVGSWKNSKGEQFTLAYRFNGSTWTMQSTPNPSGSTENVLQDVSCATETSCTAAGSQEGAEGETQTLAEKWNGTSWSIQGTSNPSGAAFSSLLGVSCNGTTCMGAGWSTDGSGVDTTLGELRE
jgi:hypothetical protein